MTQTITIREGRANVFVAVEHANSEVVGIHASWSANRFEALKPMRQGVHRCFGTIAPGVARGLRLRHDHGSNYMSGDFLWTKADELRLSIVMGLRKGLSLRRALTEDEQGKVATRIVEHLESNNWKIDQCPAREGHGPHLMSK
jgi:hypothetical protein